MIHPTEMTVATGTVTYSGDPESDEGIRSREVRVSVTFQIDEKGADLADLAFARAAEVERARMAAQERIGNMGTPGTMEKIERDQADTHGAAPDDAPPDYDRPPSDPSSDGLEPPETGRWDEEEGDDEESEEGCIGPRYERPRCWTPPVPPERTGAAPPRSSTPDAEIDWATKPQVLALGSHFRRLGIGPADQTALLRNRFGKFRAERLTREEAAGLMRSLERGEVELTPVDATGTTDGRRFTGTPA